jgi:hypothetical protein
MIDFLFNESVIVKRRPGLGSSSGQASRDSFNNPVYGAPTAGWTTVYSTMKCKLAFSGTPIEFAPTGERVKPQGVMYFSSDNILQHEDRIITSNGIEYVVTSLQYAYMTPQVIDHTEATIELP